MSEKVEPRQDGKCVGCETAMAVTIDGLLCKRCLKTALDNSDPLKVRDLNRQGTEQIGRPALDARVIGGAPF